MHNATIKFIRSWQLVAASFVFLVLPLALQQSAVASCGDYLLHGPIATDTYAGVANVPVSHGVGTSERNSMPSSTPSPCAGGRCKQAPPPEPTNVPWRVVVWKQVAFGFADDNGIGDRKDSFRARSNDDMLLPSPFLAVEIHPPIAA